MASNSTRKMFLNLAVREVKRSIAFFTQLGFTFNPEFTDDKAACMVVNPDTWMMLLSEPFFKAFTKREICDTGSHAESLIALAYDSRAEVDDLVNRAIQAGGARRWKHWTGDSCTGGVFNTSTATMGKHSG